MEQNFSVWYVREEMEEIFVLNSTEVICTNSEKVLKYTTIARACVKSL